MPLDYFLTKEIIQFSFRYDWLDILGIFFASYLSYIFIFFFILLLIWDFKVFFLASFSAFFSWALVRFLRFFIEKQRPLYFFENVLASAKESQAFPSGHAAFFFAFSTIIYFYNKKIGISFFVLSFLMSLARVYTGYHWTFDVLAGALIGILFAYLIKKSVSFLF